jgi:hypothetical protein
MDLQATWLVRPEMRHGQLDKTSPAARTMAKGRVVKSIHPMITLMTLATGRAICRGIGLALVSAIVDRITMTVEERVSKIADVS